MDRNRLHRAPRRGRARRPLALGRRPDPLTEGEYERRVAEARGTTRRLAAAGLCALDTFVNPKAAEAVEVQKDLKAGFYNDEQKKGEGDKPGAAGKRSEATD